MNMRNGLLLAGTAILLGSLGAVSCSAAESGSSPFGLGGGGGLDASSETGGAGGSGGIGDAAIFDTSFGDSIDPDAACDYIVENGNLTPLSLYIAYDKSSSMLGTKWDGGLAGLQAFLNDPKSAGIKVAFNLFPRAPDSTPPCDQFAYKEPKIPYDSLPQNAAPILALLGSTTPDGTTTPIYPALGGAILKAIEVSAPGESSAVLLVTDGEPVGPSSQCAGVNPEDPQVIADIAAVGASKNPPVYTYVIGLPGANQAFANQVAAAGKGAAIFVGSSNVQVEFQQALAVILGKALPCEYLIPEKVDKGDVNPGNVNVLFTPGGATSPETIPQTTDCSQGGWQYDNPAHPTRLILCPSTCEEIRADLEGKVEIMLGCKTVVK